MSEIHTFTVDKMTPPRDAVFENQGIPPGAPVDQRVVALYDDAVDLFMQTADCMGIISEISSPDCAAVYHGEGQNEPQTPVGVILGRANDLALFAVTLGEPICVKIAELFGSNDYALGCMLDSVASVSTDRAAEVAENRFREILLARGSLASASAVLRYSPGYCGWHMSGQKKLFEFLKPDRIGIKLRDSFLMEPLKSVSGVVIAGSREIHDFPMAYSFCAQCETRGCRERIRALQAE